MEVRVQGKPKGHMKMDVLVRVRVCSSVYITAELTCGPGQKERRMCQVKQDN